MSKRPFNKNGLRLVSVIPHGEAVVGMTAHHGSVFLATKTRVYRLAQRRKGTYKLVPVLFQENA